MTMRVAQLRQADLNLLVHLVVLIEERSISRAARRLGLSAPAVSRSLGRLRELFADQLLIRTPSGHEITARAQALLDEMAVILPRIDRLISGLAFDPSRDKASFSLCATDNATQLFGPILCRDLPAWPSISFVFSPWTDDRFVELDRNRLDLVLDARIDAVPDHLCSEFLFDDEFVCVAATDSPHPDRLSMPQYLAADHIGVNVLHKRQTIPELALARIGEQRRCVLSVPYFTVALRLVPNTPFLVTLPRRLAQAYADLGAVRLIQPPPGLGGYSYLMLWHPRHSSDPQHLWLRQTIRDATRHIPALHP